MSPNTPETELKNVGERPSSFISVLGNVALRNKKSLAAGLLSSWSGLAFGVVLAILGGLGTGLLLAFHSLGFLTSTHPFGIETSSGLTVLGVIGAIAAGFVSGFLALYVLSPIGAISGACIGMLFGIVTGIVATLIEVTIEPKLLKLKNYREPSNRETNIIVPAFEGALEDLGITRKPAILIVDSQLPNAKTYAKTIVISSSIVNNFEKGELKAVLSHELWHWQQGDGIGYSLFRWCSWELVLLYNIAKLGRTDKDTQGVKPKKGLFGLFFTIFFLWSAVLLTNYVVMPLIAKESREHEYEADLAASTIGLGNYLAEALTRLGAFEMAKSGWQGALYSTHPPMEYRIEKAKEANGDTDKKPVSGIVQPQELFKKISPVIAILIIGAFASTLNSLGYSVVNKIKTTTPEAVVVTPSAGTKEGAISQAVAFETSFGHVAYNRQGYLSLITAYTSPSERTYIDNQVDASYAQGANAVQANGAQVSSHCTVTGVKILDSTGSPLTSVSISVVFVLIYTFNNNVATPNTTIMAGLTDYAVTKETLQFSWEKGSWELTDFVPVGYISTGSGTPPSNVFSVPSGYQSP